MFKWIKLKELCFHTNLVYMHEFKEILIKGIYYIIFLTLIHRKLTSIRI
jgi:hypothetical protein